jgi:integrase
MGMIYKRGEVFWIKYYSAGRPIRESTGTTKQKQAERFLKHREGRSAAGLQPLPRVDRITYDELARDLRLHYETTGTRGLTEADTRFKALQPFFAGRRVASLKGALAKEHVQYRLKTNVTPATVNRELATLIRMLRLGYERDKVAKLPVIHKLTEAPPRAGFFERADFEAVRRTLRLDLQLAVTIAHSYGWRMQSEVLTLGLSQIDVSAGTMRIIPGGSKTGEGRLVYLSSDIKKMLEEQIERVRTVSRTLGRVIPYLFPHLTAGRLQGERIRDFRKSWASACKAAGLSGMLRHDLRRTAARNLIRSGVPEVVSMRITGHRTRAVFDRYNIVSPADLQDAARKMADGHNLGHSAPSPLDSVTVSR